MFVFAVVSLHQEVGEPDPHDAIVQDPPARHDGGIRDAPVPPASSRQGCAWLPDVVWECLDTEMVS